ncbi:MAG: hypothetical protein KBA51_06740 [Kiritimatiellae bacterium]|nr:hypothetical protein [Kiritimatiellia bacterium]
MSRRASTAPSTAGTVAMLLWLAGIVAMGVALIRLPRQRADIARDLKIEADLMRLGERVRAVDRDFDVLRAQGTQMHPTPEEVLRQKRADDGRERIEVLEPIVYRDHWKLHRVSIEISAVPPAALGAWIEDCARAPSAWRLASLRITAQDPQALNVRAETIWECAEELEMGEPGEEPGPS